ncbi:hypothetical protein BDV19DRAFT_393208 [Aspergillus venezuelensis]
MEIDPRLHADRGKSVSESVSDGEYPDPPAQGQPRHLPTSILNPYNAPANGNPHEHPNAQAGPSHSYGEPSFAPFRVSPQQPADANVDPNDPNADAKRPRACESCRSLKVRCEPDPNPEEPCKRCAKAGRSCIVTMPSRKRQKKTDSRVTELERKIDVLTASLQASQKVDALLPSNNSAQASAQMQGMGVSPEVRGEGGVGRRWLVPGQSGSGSSERSGGINGRPGGSKRQFSGELKDRGRDTAHSTPSQASNPSPASENTDNTGRQWPAVSSGWGNRSHPSTREPVRQAPRGPDIVDRGLVGLNAASNAFTRYVESMCHHIPMVVFPPGTQMSEIRKHKPVLFHAIVAVAIGPFDSSAQGPLLTELYRAIGERVIVKGEKSLDLVQGLLVACAFYTPPENFEEIKFYQLAQLAVAVAMDIGMYKKASVKGKPFNLIRDFVKHAPMTDPDSSEVRRAWLGCYFVSVQTSSALRRPILVRWLPYMDECIDILENSPDALPTDKRMIHWAKLGRVIEDISARFFADDLGGLTFNETKAQFTLKAFERQLEQWRQGALAFNDHAIMTQAQAIVNIYLHENAMVLDATATSEEQTLTDGDISSPIAAARISALSSTLTSIHDAIDTICSIPTQNLISMPTVALARTAFSVVAMIKLYSVVSAPDSYVGQVIDPAALKVEAYLDRVIAHYTAAGSLAGGVTPGKFSTVMTMLREWFKSRKDQPAPDLRKSTMQIPQHGNLEHETRAQQQQANPQRPGSTPLHLLSEVATGEPGSNQHQQYGQQQQPYASRSSFQQSPDPNSANSMSQPPLPPCLGPEDLPTNLSSTAPPTTNTTPQDAWPQPPYDPTRPGPGQGHGFYPSPNANTTSSNSASATGPAGPGGYDFSAPTNPAQNPLMMPPTPSASAASSMPMGIQMPMFMPDLGLGLDEQFWSTMGAAGDIPLWPSQGGWPFNL